MVDVRSTAVTSTRHAIRRSQRFSDNLCSLVKILMVQARSTALAEMGSGTNGDEDN